MTRRTKKEKSSAKHSFTLSWNPSSTSIEPVKSQMLDKNKSKSAIKLSNKNASLLAKDGELGSIKFNIAKSLSLASLMLAIELVIYLVAK